MTRKDIILIAVVVNAGLLAILFMTAMIYDPTVQIEQTDFLTSVTAIKHPAIDKSTELVEAVTARDEVDSVLKYYTTADSSTPINNMLHEIEIPAPIAVQSNADDDNETKLRPSSSRNENYFITVTVKKGDVLEKIARANGASVQSIKQANAMQNEHLSIGQVLKIPSIKEQHANATTSHYATKETSQSESIYYVVKAGDNPWKIAKQFNIKVEDIIHLNHLDEEKARNLKIGDRIRVK